MFAILFLGAILAVFLTLGAVRGDAERGLLQPLLVRPLPRRTLLLGRWLGATAVCAPYVIVVALGAFVLTDALGGWWPDRIVAPLLALALGVAIIAALSLAGLDRARRDRERDRRLHALRRRADRRACSARSPRRSAPTASTTSRASRPGRCRSRRSTRPASRELTADTVGFTRLAIDLGPFGGAQSGGAGLWLWSLAYLVAVGAVAVGGVQPPRPLGRSRLFSIVSGGAPGSAADGRLVRRVGRRLDAERPPPARRSRTSP